MKVSLVDLFCARQTATHSLDAELQKIKKYSLLRNHCYTFASMKQFLRVVISYIAVIVLLPIALFVRDSRTSFLGEGLNSWYKNRVCALGITYNCNIARFYNLGVVGHKFNQANDVNLWKGYGF